MLFETKWTGEQKIVIAIDCGTTLTGVTYVHLLPQAIPKLKRVESWPGQVSQQGESKIPTIVWYDKFGNAMAFGAEAYAEDAIDAEERGWQLAKHFKLHLHPDTMRTRNMISLDPLPKGVTIKKVYTDFFEYVYTNTQVYFEQHEYQGATLWNDLQQNEQIEFVIAHPNGWGLHEQSFLRKVAEDAGLTSRQEAGRTLHMIPEAEASVHFVMKQANLKPGIDFLVCDAGGSTVDTTLYNVKNITPLLELEEKRASACVQAGGLFVDKEAEKFFLAEIDRLKIGLEPQDAHLAAGVFEKTKRNFTDPRTDVVKIRVDSTVKRLTIDTPSLSLKRGMLTLHGDTVARFFSKPVQDIITSIKQQIQGHAVETLMLVGGFGSSPYLRRELEAEFQGIINLTTVNESTAKAVADGAAAWYISSFVIARATRFRYGITVRVPHDTSDRRQIGRAVSHELDGEFVNGVWSEIVAKDRILACNEVQRCAYYRTYDSPTPHLGTFTVELLAHTGSGTAPYFTKNKQGNRVNDYTIVCDVTADLSNISGTLEKKYGPRGVYWKLGFEIGIFFGGTELAARLYWKDKWGGECQGEVSLIPGEFH